jgi:hypothetical protein
MKCEEETIPKIRLWAARERGMFGLGLEHRVGEGEC